MATGAEDYWGSKYIKTNLDNAIDKLQTSIDKLIEVITELTGVHTDTTAMVAYGEEDWSGTVTTAWTLIADVNDRRNMLKIDNLSEGHAYAISRDAGATEVGYINQQSSATFYDAAGVWLHTATSYGYFDAHEEWAT